VVRLEPVVVAAEPIELGEDGVMALAPGLPVVDLGVRPELLAALAAAGRLRPHERDLLRRRRAPAEVDNGGDVLAAGDHKFEDRVPEEIACNSDGNRPDSRDLAPFLLRGGAAHERFNVDT
jgi:hypothetical protein